jgi:hypothetical protein
MKPSHSTTPRTLSECYFDPRGSAIANSSELLEKPLKEHYNVLSLLWRMLTGR